MKGLQHLELIIKKRLYGRLHYSLQGETEILDPLLIVRQPKTFIVRLAWSPIGQEYEWEGMPFQILWPYTEANIDQLYTLNTFRFHWFGNIIPFSSSITPHHLDSIQSLNLHYDLRNPRSPLTNLRRRPLWKPGPKWCQVWELVAGMQGLKHLEVDFIAQIDGCLNKPLRRHEEDRLLKPLTAIQHPKKFVVRVSWPLNVPNIDDYYEKEEIDRANMPFDFVSTC
ncbi:MAG: hypothetical protein Q9164_004594 [Protoblastenia rupestris]